MADSPDDHHEVATYRRRHSQDDSTIAGIRQRAASHMMYGVAERTEGVGGQIVGASRLFDCPHRWPGAANTLSDEVTVGAHYFSIPSVECWAGISRDGRCESFSKSVLMGYDTASLCMMGCAHFEFVLGCASVLWVLSASVGFIQLCSQDLASGRYARKMFGLDAEGDGESSVCGWSSMGVFDWVKQVEGDMTHDMHIASLKTVDIPEELRKPTLTVVDPDMESDTIFTLTRGPARATEVIETSGTLLPGPFFVGD